MVRRHMDALGVRKVIAAKTFPAAAFLAAGTREAEAMLVVLLVVQDLCVTQFVRVAVYFANAVDPEIAVPEADPTALVRAGREVCRIARTLGEGIKIRHVAQNDFIGFSRRFRAVVDAVDGFDEIHVLRILATKIHRSHVRCRRFPDAIRRVAVVGLVVFVSRLGIVRHVAAVDFEGVAVDAVCRVAHGLAVSESISAISSGSKADGFAIFHLLVERSKVLDDEVLLCFRFFADVEHVAAHAVIAVKVHVESPGIIPQRADAQGVTAVFKVDVALPCECCDGRRTRHAPGHAVAEK